MLLTDWFAHTPPDVLAKNSPVAQEVFDDVPLHNLWIFPGDEPGDLEADQVAAALVTVKPGSMRELHWHPNADDWQYYMKGSAHLKIPRRPSPSSRAGRRESCRGHSRVGGRRYRVPLRPRWLSGWDPAR